MKCQCVAQVRSFDQENPLFQFELGGENEIHNYRIGCPPDPAVSHDTLEIVDSSCFGRTVTTFDRQAFERNVMSR